MIETPYRYVPGDRPVWVTGESPCTKWTQSVLRHFQNEYNIKTFIETGTCRGETLLGVHDSFEKCYTIELSKEYFDQACQNFASAKASNISAHFGNSVKVLPSILFTIPKEEKLLFFLDAHVSGPGSADEGDPLAGEVQIILDQHPNSILVIDDQPTPEYFLNTHPQFETALASWTAYWAGNIQMYYKNV